MANKESPLKIQWKTEKRKTSDLKNWAKNPRIISKKKYEELKQKIIDQGMNDVLKIDTDNTVLSGNQRLEVLRELEISEVEVKVPERKLTDEERDRVGLSSNINDGEWDNDKLANEFELDLMRDVGFDTSFLHNIMDDTEQFEGEEDFTTEILEENNYVLFVFDNVMDWNYVKQKLDIKAVQSLDSKKGYKRKGVGRVLDGKKLLTLLDKK